MIPTWNHSFRQLHQSYSDSPLLHGLARSYFFHARHLQHSLLHHSFTPRSKRTSFPICSTKVFWYSLDCMPSSVCFCFSSQLPRDAMHSANYADARYVVRPSVRLSTTRRYPVKTVKHILILFHSNKHFNFCCFRALAYTTLDRLCTVFLYNICCFITVSL